MLLKQLMSSYLADILSEKWQRNPNCIQSRMVAMVKVFSISDRQTKCILGTPVCTNIDEFLEKFQRGGRGSFPIQKISLQNFQHQKRQFGGVISVPKIFVEKNRNIFPKKGGEGSKAVWNFSKKSSILVQTGVPQSNATLPQCHNSPSKLLEHYQCNSEQLTQCTQQMQENNICNKSM